MRPALFTSILIGTILSVSLSGVAPARAETRLYWSSAGPIGGLACTQVVEGASPPEHTWRDNYLCAERDIGLRWSSSGPIPGLTCTQISEGAEPPQYTWRDNYLCLPRDSTLSLLWSSSGPVAGLPCVRMDEGSDPYTWQDNFLCWREAVPRADLLTITEIRNIKPAGGLDAAGKFAFGAITAAVSAAASGTVSLGDLYDSGRLGVEVGQFLDRQFSGQDDLIVKIDGRAVLPRQGAYLPMQAGQVVRPNVQASLNGAARLRLIEWDGGSDNDDLGSITIIGGRDYAAKDIVVVAPAAEDGSIYLVSYRVEAGRGDPQAVVRSMLCGTNQCDECLRLDCSGQPYGELDPGRRQTRSDPLPPALRRTRVRGVSAVSRRERLSPDLPPQGRALIESGPP